MQWEERLEKAAFRSHFDRVRVLASGLSETTPKSAESTEVLDRIIAVVGFVERVIDSIDARLIASSVLASTDSYATQILSGVEAYASTGEASQLTAANDAADGLLNAVGAAPTPSFPSMANSDAVHGLRAELAAMTEEVRATRERSRNEFEALRVELQQLHSTTSNQLESDRAASVQELAQLRESAQQDKVGFSGTVESFNQRLQGEIQRLDQTISDVQGRFNQSEQQRQELFSNQQSKFDQSFADSSATQSQLASELLDGQRSAGTQLIDFLQSTAQQAETILGVTAASGAAGSFDKEARRQLWQMYIWRFLAFASLVGAAWVAIDHLGLLDPLGEASLGAALEYYIPRLGVTGLLASITAYAVREATHHRNRQMANQRIADQLKAFRPFLAELEPEARNELIKEASRRYFQGEGEPAPNPK